MRAWLSAILNVAFVDDFSIAVVNFVVLWMHDIGEGTQKWPWFGFPAISPRIQFPICLAKVFFSRGILHKLCWSWVVNSKVFFFLRIIHFKSTAALLLSESIRLLKMWSVEAMHWVSVQWAPSMTGATGFVEENFSPPLGATCKVAPGGGHWTLLKDGFYAHQITRLDPRNGLKRLILFFSFSLSQGRGEKEAFSLLSHWCFLYFRKVGGKEGYTCYTASCAIQFQCFGSYHEMQRSPF